MPNFHIPIRTCIVCKNKFEQSNLNRFKCENKKLLPYDKHGRSFYICNECLAKDLKTEKRLEKALFKECRNKDDYILQLKEILEYVR